MFLPPSARLRTKLLVPARNQGRDRKSLAQCFAGETNPSSMASMNV